MLVGYSGSVAAFAPSSSSEISPRSLTLAGTSLIAVSFGLARYGYGLFVPQFRDDLHLSSAQIGAFSSVSYIGYGLGLLGCGALLRRLGARSTALISATLVSIGIFAIASAVAPAILAVGVGVAGTGVGLSWPPFSDLAAHCVEPSRRPRVVSTISTGTSFGLILAVPLAILAGPAWRAVWLSFGVLSLLALASNALILPRVPDGKSRTASRLTAHRDARQLALLTTYSAIYGVLGAVFFTFAVELANANHHGRASSSLLWAIVGATGLVAVRTGDAVQSVGLRNVNRVVFLGMAAGLLCIGMAPASLGLLYTGAAIFGPFYMAGAAIVPAWAERIDPSSPSRPHTIATAFSALGSIAGAAATGAMGSTTGLPAVFTASAALAVFAGFSLGCAAPTTGPKRSRPAA
jgi:predicted MFS family arabinose efflux permease